MNTCMEAFYDAKKQLQPLFDEREATAIAHELMQYVTGLSKTQLLLNKTTTLTIAEQQKYQAALSELILGKPLQYVMGHSWFMGKEFTVNEHVLIPRPETEELVAWVVDDHKNTKKEIAILDIGTGSGCIAVMLKLLLPHAKVTACDISLSALDVAQENALKHDVEIEFIKMDFLAQPQHTPLGIFDIVVSNPPYIPLSEKEKLHKNVTGFEPGLALFVEDNNPLVFYKAISNFGNSHLTINGCIYCEIEQSFAGQCRAVFENAGYPSVVTRKDMHGNWRMVKCIK